MMINAMAATQQAVFEALEAAALAWPVHDSVPENTEPPFHKIGAISSINEEDSDQLEKLSVEIQTIYRGGDRTEMIAEMHAVRVALDGQLIAAEGADLSAPRFLDAHASDPAADGVTYAGISNFEVWCEPA